jgi:hypothetical protein
MNLLDKVIQEWSVKTDKGYPDILSKEDMDLFESMFGFKLVKEVLAEEYNYAGNCVTGLDDPYFQRNVCYDATEMAGIVDEFSNEFIQADEFVKKVNWPSDQLGPAEDTIYDFAYNKYKDIYWAYDIDNDVHLFFVKDVISEAKNPNDYNEDTDLFESMSGFRLNEESKILQEQDTTQEDISIEDLKKLIDVNAGNKKLLQRLYRTLTASPSIKKLKDELNTSGITKDVFDNRDIHSEIINILQKGQESEIDTFIEVIGKSNIPDEGNIYTTIKTLSKSKLYYIASLTGAKGSVTMGKGEIIFSLLFKNVKLLKSKAGDFDIDGQTVELKDIKGRMGEGRAATKYIPINKNITAGTLLGNIIQDYSIAENSKEVLENINKFILDAYYKGKSKSNSKINPEDLTSEETLQLKLYENAIRGYAETKNIGRFMFFNSKTGEYKLYTPEEVVGVIKGGNIRLTSITTSSTIPQLISFS